MEWKNVDGFEDLYRVSSAGDVYSVRSNRNLTPCVHGTGYLHVVLCGNDGRKKDCDVHRIVAKSFIPNPKGYTEVNHINGVKTDNSVSNLEWVTRSENMKHADEMGLRNIRGENHYKHKLTMEQVKYIRENYIKGDRKQGARAMSKKFGVSKTNILCIVEGKTWKY